MTTPQKLPAEIQAGWLAAHQVAGCEIEAEPVWFTTCKRWAFPLVLRCPGARPWIPADSRWYAVLDPSYPYTDVEVYPAADGGLSDTFAHQRQNGEPRPGRPWRQGALCLTTAWIEGPRRDLAAPPRDAARLLSWTLARAHQWLLRAASGTLQRTGDPYEAPDFGSDNPTDLGSIVVPGLTAPQTWLGVREVVGGYASLCTVQPSHDRRITLVRSLSGVALAPWGAYLREMHGTICHGAWLRLPVPPQFRPWQTPRTWGEFRDWANNYCIDLDPPLTALLASLRGRAPVLVLAYPIPTRIGGPYEQIAWQALRLPRLPTLRERLRHGRKYALSILDRRGPLGDAVPIQWLRTDVWSHDRLSVRGVLDESLQSAKVALIGAGAIGSHLAHLLIRGGVRHLHIIDNDSIEVGNLVRHTATLNDLGTAKATALRRTLSLASPYVEVLASPNGLPRDPSAAAALVDEATLIIDATASDEVLATLAALPDGRSRRWASLSLSRDAERLYCFTAEATSFPVDDFHAAYRPWQADDLAHRPEPLPWAGAGCWDPIFPARIDDIATLVARCVRHLEQSIRDPPQEPEWRVFTRAGDPHALAQEKGTC